MIGFYFDEHMRHAVEKELIQLSYTVVMAINVDMQGKDDDTEHLPYATNHKLIVVTFDRPFAGRTAKRTDHAGLICLSEDIRKDVGRCIQVLVEFAETHTLEEAAGQVFWLK